MVRRLFIIMTLTLLVRHPNLQVWLYLLASSLSLQYLIHKKPFDTTLLNVTEKVNECFILLIAYHLFGCTSMITDLENQYKIGWSMIGTIVANVVFNLVVFVIVVVQSCKQMCKRRKAIKDYKNKLEEAKERRAALKELQEERKKMQDGADKQSSKDQAQDSSVMHLEDIDAPASATDLI